MIRAIPAVFGVAFFWILYFAAVWFQIDLIDLLKFREQPKQLDRELYFNLAIGASAVIPIATWWFTHKALYFARHGIPVDAIVRSVGIVKAAGGMFDITYDYEFRGRT